MSHRLLYRIGNASPSQFTFRVICVLLIAGVVVTSFCGCAAFGVRKAPTEEQKVTAGQGVMSTEAVNDGLSDMQDYPRNNPVETLKYYDQKLSELRYFASVAAQCARMVAIDFGQPSEPATIAPPPQTSESPEVTEQREHDTEVREKANSDAANNRPDPSSALDLIDLILGIVAGGTVIGGSAAVVAKKARERFRATRTAFATVVGQVQEAIDAKPEAGKEITAHLSASMDSNTKAAVHEAKAEWEKMP